jgi:TusA-related sulfurtransferase
MVTFDIREKLIPFSLLQITHLFREMQPGEDLEIIAGSCPVETAIFKDVLRILPRSDYELISQERSDADTPVTRMKLRKKVC